MDQQTEFLGRQDQGPARSEGSGSSSASAGASLGPSHHLRRPGNSASSVDLGKEYPGRHDPGLTMLQPATSRTARGQLISSDLPLQRASSQPKKGKCLSDQ